MIKTQFDSLAALLSAGLTHKITPDVDLSKADWDILMPFVRENHLVGIVNEAMLYYKTKEQPLPDLKLRNEIARAAAILGISQLGHFTAMVTLNRQWMAEDRRPLALGGVGLSSLYPPRVIRGGNELACMPIYKSAKPDTSEGAQPQDETFTVKSLKVTVSTAMLTRANGKRGAHEDAVLGQAFFAAPCSIDKAASMAVPNPGFRALYHLYTAQQLLLNSRLPFIMVLDWAMLLRLLCSAEFDWAAFLEQVSDLGLTSFAQSLTALALRFTGDTLPEAAASLTASDEDVAFLFSCIVDGSEDADSDKGRLSRFFGVLRNSKKYSRFSELSPTKEAFRYLFS